MVGARLPDQAAIAGRSTTTSPPCGRSHPRRGTGRAPTPGRTSAPDAEQRFFAGEDPARVIAELRDRHAPDYAQVPTERTMRRWFHERRWLRQKPVLEISDAGNAN